MKKTIDLCNENSRGKEEPMERKKLERKVDVRKVIVCVVMAIVVAIAGLVMYSENVHKIGFIENVKQAIEEMINTNNEVAIQADVTTIDVTGIEPGDVGNHVCSEYYISKYDETYHWNECKLCGKEYDKVAHSLIDNGWSMGSASVCSESNVHKYSCSCGYSYTSTDGRSKHNMVDEWSPDFYCKRSICQTCFCTELDHNCINKDNGERIGCNNLGTCSICNHVWTESNSYHWFMLDNKCINCDEQIDVIEKEVTSVDAINNIMKVRYSALLPKGSTDTGWSILISGYGTGSTVTYTSYNSNQDDRTVVTYDITVKFKEKQYLKRKYVFTCLSSKFIKDIFNTFWIK